MEFLRKLLVQTRYHFQGLTSFQRFTYGLCLVLIVAAFIWLIPMTGAQSMVPLLDQPMTAKELDQIEQHLGVMKVSYKTVGQIILVPADRRVQLQAQLAQLSLLPKDTSMGFDKLMQEKSFWRSSEENRRHWNVAKGNELARVIREFEGVLEAKVFIDKSTARTLGATRVRPKASVFVRMAAGCELDGRRAFALANLVCGAVAGLDVDKISITDATTGRSYNVPKTAEGSAFDDIEIRQRKEQYFADRIRDLLANIPGLLVSVHAELNPEYMKETVEIHGDPVELSEKSEYLTHKPADGEPAGATMPAGVIDKAVTETTYDAKVNTTITTTELPRNGIKSLTASVNVPRSYLAHIYKINHRGEEPGDAEIERVGVPELDKIKRQVMGALAIEDEQDWRVKVDWFHDNVETGPLIEQIDREEKSDALLLVQKYGGKAGIGVLAVMSLFVVLMLVRKAGNGPVTTDNGTDKTRLQDRRDFNSVSSGAPVRLNIESLQDRQMDGDPDRQTQYTQQMVGQIAEAVRREPQKAVDILKHWIETEQS